MPLSCLGLSLNLVSWAWQKRCKDWRPNAPQIFAQLATFQYSFAARVNKWQAPVALLAPHLAFTFPTKDFTPPSTVCTVSAEVPRSYAPWNCRWYGWITCRGTTNHPSDLQLRMEKDARMMWCYSGITFRSWDGGYKWEWSDQHLRYTSWDDHPPSREDEGIQEKVMWNHEGNVSMYVLRSVYVIYYCLETFSNIPCLKTNSSPL